jgi:hypothetical protein
MMPRRFAGSHHRPFDTITPQEAAPMRTGFEGPAERACNLVHEAIALAHSMAMNDKLSSNVRDDATNIALLLREVPADVDALADYMRAQDHDLNGVLDSNHRMAREITELRREAEAAQQTAARYVEREVPAAPTNDDATAA